MNDERKNEFAERLVVGAEGGYLQRALDKAQMAGWVQRLAPWQIISHLTFRWESSLDSARRSYEKFMRQKLPHVSYFYAEEANPGRPGYHVHALWADCRNVFRKEAWAAWFKRNGRARIEPVRSTTDVARYCSKYVTKQLCWWNCHLQWHRVQALRGEAFELERDTRLPVPQREFGFAPDVFNLAVQVEGDTGGPRKETLAKEVGCAVHSAAEGGGGSGDTLLAFDRPLDEQQSGLLV